MNTRYAFVAFLFLLLAFFVPCYLSFLLFWHDVSIPVTSEQTTDGKVFVELDVASLESEKRALVRKIFQAPFELTTYEFCFHNRTRIAQGGETRFVAGNVTLEDEGGVLIYSGAAEPNSQYCIPVEFQEFYISNITVTFTFIPWMQAQIDADVAAISAQPPADEKISVTVIFLFAWWGMFLVIWGLFRAWRDVSTWSRRP